LFSVISLPSGEPKFSVLGNFSGKPVGKVSRFGKLSGCKDTKKE
jgi:hypothetical protein